MTKKHEKLPSRQRDSSTKYQSTFEVTFVFSSHLEIGKWIGDWQRPKFNSFLASRGFCHLLINIANSLDTNQDRQNVRPDLDPNFLTTALIVFLKEFF